ncbi:hypothetical protein AALM99_04285 [Lactococcus muris]|uniref:Uncharacterized protein n=1 Tax=Lactococcus muris TaxID=2941330 RepID=A0ABV4D7C4_9LACT
MNVETKTKKQTTETEYQEINIYKILNEDNWRISCNIPKLARKYRKFLISGFEVINENSGRIIEIHGIIDNCNVSISKKVELTEEQRKKSVERAKKYLAMSRNKNNVSN